jgi:diguanylate cyclase (GGDEF)-like protein/PAS domain S-box-containing protein
MLTPAAVARLYSQTSRVASAAQDPRETLAAVLAAIRGSLDGIGAAILAADKGRWVAVARDNLEPGAEPLDEAALAGIGGPGYALVHGAGVEGRLVVSGVRRRVLTAYEKRLTPLLDLAAVALRDMRLARAATRAADELRFQAGLLDAVEQAVIVCDLNRQIIYWNRFAETLYGWSAAEVLGRTVTEVLVPRASASAGFEIMEQVVEGHSWTGEFVVQRRDGTSFPCKVTDSPLRNPSGAVVGVIGISVDISARKRAEEVQARLAAIVTSSDDAIVAQNMDGTITDWNTGAEAVYGYSAAEIVGQPGARLLPPERSAEAADYLARLAGGESIAQFETVRLHKDGRRIDMSVRLTPIRSQNGSIVGAAGIGRDITEQKKADTVLTHQAQHDGLTGLANRTLLHTRIQQALPTEYGESPPLAVLLLDLDRFKGINDTLGHQVGDVLLQQIARRLQGAVRASDLVARIGGDEFAVLLPGANATGAAFVAESLVRVLQAPFILEGQPLDVDASIGIALSPAHGQDADALLRCADVAMYQAKRAGTGVALYSLADDDHHPDRLALLGKLRAAIDNDELLLHYQPKLDLHDGTLVGTEALVRWQHPERGFLPPSEFIPLAEQNGLISPLSRWVLNAALKQHRAWRLVGIDVPVAVNLSRRTLRDPQLVEMVGGALKRWSARPGTLLLEITESSLMADPVHASDCLTRLRALGIRIAIDDFGTGYSSLASLKNLSVDELKIDQSFVQAMSTDASSRAIVRAIVDLADALQLRSVAEGVEDRATLDVLAGLGCDVAQGYFLGPPLAANDFEVWVRNLSPAWLATSEPTSVVDDALQERIRGRGARLTAEEEFIARKAAEVALQASEERNRLALQATGMGTWEWDVTRDVRTWSAKTLALHGLTPATLGADLAVLERAMHPDDWPGFLLELQASRLEHRDSRVTYRTVWPDGSTHWIESKGRAIYADDGTLLRGTGTCVDVTERKEAEAALRASEERFRMQYKGLPLPTFSWVQVGDDFVMQDYNDAAETITDGHISEWLGRTARECYVDQPQIPADLQTCATEHRTLRRELAYAYVHTRRERQLAVTYVFVPPHTVMIHTEDITEARQAEQQRETMAQSEKLRALGQMATGIAHDLNQSLMLVASYSDLAQQALLQDPPDLDGLQDLLTTTTQAALDGGQSVKRLLLFTRATPAQDGKPVDLSSVVREAAQLTAPRWRAAAQAEGRPIRLDVELEGEPVIHGSAARLRELLTNLIFNAVDALPTGGSIRLRVATEGSEGIIEVTDSGLGMSAEVQARVFEPFFTTKGERGTGLGLAMVFGIVEQHAGHLSVRSAPGDGTTFRIAFPLVEPVAALTSVVDQQVGSAAPPSVLRVLAVDDEPMMTRALVRMLRPSGHAVVAAGSGEEALEKLAQQTFDVIVSDMGMGAGMNGWELADVVKHRWPGTRFLLATGWGAAIDPLEARARGVESVLAKPYHRVELLQALARLGAAA